MRGGERTALVTGASAGLGAAIALEMAQLGWNLMLGARRIDRLRDTAERAREAGAKQVYASALDVTDQGSVEQFFGEAEAAVGPADVIVNNAGASRYHDLAETDAAWLRTEVETNLIGPMVVTHRALTPLLAAEATGDVVMVTSDAARRPRPGQLAYGASKAGLENYADGLAMALEGTGIRVVKLRLGPAVSEFGLSWDLTPEVMEARTRYWATFGLRDARMLTQENMGILMPEDVGHAIVHAVTQPRHVLLDTIELQPAVPQRPKRNAE